MSDEENKTRATTGVKFSAFKQVGPQEGNPVEVVGLRDGENVRAPLTTDLIETNPDITFRNSKGQFASPDPGVTELTNQLKVNRYLYDRMIERGVTIDVAPPDIYADGTFWFDNTEDTMQLFLWHEESGAWLPVAPPTTLEGRVDAGEATQQAIIAQIQESLADQADLANRISDGEAEQLTLKNKINALEGVLGEHSFIFTTSNRNPRPGEFNLQDGGMNITNSIDSADYIALSNVDANGKDVNLDRIVENDVIRIGSIEGGSAELRVTSSTGGLCQFEQVSGDLNRLSEVPYDFVLLSSFDPAGLATIEYVDAQDAVLSTMITANGRALNDKVDKSGNQNLDKSKAWKLKQEKQDGGESTFVSINDGEMNLYHVATPSAPTHAANMQYVDDQIAAIPAPSGVPVGCIMIWMNSSVPAGWLKLQGASFSTSDYPELHAYLQGTNGYTSGKLPNWSGHYPGEYGDHLAEPNPALGKKVGHRTAQPAGGAPRSSNAIPNGNKRTFNGTGGTNAYSDGSSKVTINEGWDDTTRPKTVIVHYIIKAKP